MFKRARANTEIKDGAPPGNTFPFNNESTSVAKELFVVWMIHFN
jgi:hypothetical protein